MKRLREILNEGTPQTGHEVVHHISPFDIKNDDFHPLSHFGTYKAARTVGSQTHHDEYIKHGEGATKQEYRERFHYKARLVNHLKTVHLDEDPLEHTPMYFVHALRRAGVFSDEEAQKHSDNLSTLHREHGSPNHIEAKQYVADAAREKGVGMISYTNDVEDKGKKSYVITHPNQVKVLKKTPIEVKNSILPKDNRTPVRKRNTEIKWHGKTQ